MRTPPLRLALLPAFVLSACLADPAPETCASGRDCPVDTPWCVAGACAIRPAELTDAGPRCSPEARCAAVCGWLVRCVDATCPDVLGGTPGLSDEVLESCHAQCRVDGAVAEALCDAADAGECQPAVDDMQRVLGFGICP